MVSSNRSHDYTSIFYVHLSDFSREMNGTTYSSVSLFIRFYLVLLATSSNKKVNLILVLNLMFS